MEHTHTHTHTHTHALSSLNPRKGYPQEEIPNHAGAYRQATHTLAHTSIFTEGHSKM